MGNAPVSEKQCRQWRQSGRRPFKLYLNSDYTLPTVRRHIRGQCPHFADEDERDTDGQADGDTYSSRHGSEFRQAREEALQQAGYQCEQCGLTDEEHRQRDGLFGEGLHVHHKKDTTAFDDMSKAHDLSNLVVLCADCHGV